MPRNGNGLYTLPAGNPVISGTVITATWCNPTMSDIAQALTNSLAANGEASATNNLPMAGYRHTTVGVALAEDQYTRADQTQTSEFVLVTSPAVGPQDVYSGSLALGVTTFTQGQIIYFHCPASNVGSTTLTINGAGPYPILHTDGSPTVLGDLIANEMYGLWWNSNHWRFLSSASDLSLLDARYIQKSGGTMLGPLKVLAPAVADDATPKGYVDTGLAARLSLSGGTLTGPLTLAGDPAAPLQAATRQYVLAAIAGATAGVSSFNTRVGAVVLLPTDVTGALGYSPANAAGQTFTGAVTAPSITSSGTSTARGFVQTPFSTSISGNYAIDFANGQSQIITLTGAAVITAINNAPVGSILRVTLIGTNNTVTWPGAGIAWPLGTAPILNSGPRDEAVVVFSNTGSVLHASATMY